MASTERPIHEIRVGRVRASIWRNANDNGGWFSVQVTRHYRDGEVWKTTSSFSRDDMPLVSKAAEMAYAWIWNNSERHNS